MFSSLRSAIGTCWLRIIASGTTSSGMGEIIKEIKCFREKNENVRVVLYNSNSENSEKIFIEENVADL